MDPAFATGFCEDQTRWCGEGPQGLEGVGVVKCRGLAWSREGQDTPVQALESPGWAGSAGSRGTSNEVGKARPAGLGFMAFLDHTGWDDSLHWSVRQRMVNIS